MAYNFSLCLIAAMDRLWFQQIILFPETQLQPKQPQLQPYSESSSSSSLSLSSVADQQEAAPDGSRNREEQTKKRSRRGNHSRLHSSPTQKLRKSTSCRSLKDLELEEVKGFMDLGFIFTKEHLNPTMIHVVPGLLRLGFPKRIKSTEQDDELQKDDGTEQEEKKRVVIRPYLSEAWLIKRPDSPLLNLRVPRVSAAADMKKHLKFWARTVASVVQQES
ncbi:hypothetical protein HRI_003970700 [Hibiscus trionum]|uniref:Uncharacterized protein n=1 Tax=Hibiscus trionum TaxID=183268 RepID=A0A9W7IW24_HIBTR|nr:hypothetical protein HRI_003970700 [Hibiscus trionum]